MPTYRVRVPVVTHRQHEIKAASRREVVEALRAALLLTGCGDCEYQWDAIEETDIEELETKT